MPPRSRTERAGFILIKDLAAELGTNTRTLLGDTFDAGIDVHVPAIERAIAYEHWETEPATQEEIADCFDILDDPDEEPGPPTEAVIEQWEQYQHALEAGVVSVRSERPIARSFVLDEDDLFLLCNGEVAHPRHVRADGRSDLVALTGTAVAIDEVAVLVEDAERIRARVGVPKVTPTMRATTSASDKGMFADARALVALALLSSRRRDLMKAGDSEVIAAALQSLAAVEPRKATDDDVRADLTHALGMARNTLERRVQRPVKQTVGVDLLRAAASAQNCTNGDVPAHGALAKLAAVEGKRWGQNYVALDASESAYLRVFKRLRELIS